VGSGITSALRSGFGTERVYDHLNAGSLFNLRHEILVRVARMIDGRIRPTPLKNAILRYLGIRNEDGYAELLYRGRLPWDRVARTPKIIFRYWLKGDCVARELVESAARDYAVTAAAMVRRTGSRRATAVFGGGVIDNAPDPFRRLVHRRFRELVPGARPRKPIMSPAHGACVMAAYMAGEDPAEFFRKLVKNIGHESWRVSG
jgi:N-acetylglucosamine kinase-like BadF-type ATPase